MKLSEKGKRKFLDNFYWFSEEFDQDDFEGCVILTVEEAKGIYDDLIRLSEMSSLDISRYYAWKRLNERIEQAEGK
ncbi:MAG: hypothetical protein J6S13_05620 [Clostridia bacterium]|nr:hypothetical protein [Clostridia bacterium]